MPSPPGQSANSGSYPGLNQEGGVSIYNPPMAQDGGAQGYQAAPQYGQSASTVPANGTQPTNYEAKPVELQSQTRLTSAWQNILSQGSGNGADHSCMNCGGWHAGMIHPNYCYDCIIKGETPVIYP